MNTKTSASPKKEALSEATKETQNTPTPRPWYLTPRDTPKETRQNFVQSLCIESDSGFVMRVSDLGHAHTERQRRTDAEYIICAVNSFEEIKEALQKIADRGVRGSDTGWEGCNCPGIARAVLAKVEAPLSSPSEAPKNTYSES